jgi:hypothetical protein
VWCLGGWNLAGEAFLLPFRLGFIWCSADRSLAG